MNNKIFKERLEEILENLSAYIATSTVQGYQERRKYDDVKVKESTQSLITLFEDYTKAIVGEEDTEVRGTTQSPSNPMYWTKRTKHRNELRQTINQTSKTILRGSE